MTVTRCRRTRTGRSSPPCWTACCCCSSASSRFWGRSSSSASRRSSMTPLPPSTFSCRRWRNRWTSYWATREPVPRRGGASGPVICCWCGSFGVRVRSRTGAGAATTRECDVFSGVVSLAPEMLPSAWLLALRWWWVGRDSDTCQTDCPLELISHHPL